MTDQGFVDVFFLAMGALCALAFIAGVRVSNA
jgi:hypothetical protein